MPWSGPDLGGEVVVEHRGGGGGLANLVPLAFISGNPDRMAGKVP